MSTEKTKTPGKVGLVITYLLVFACLVLGWVLPMHDGNKMLITYFASIVNNALGGTIIPVEGFFENTFVGFSITTASGFTFAISEWGLLIYAFATVVSVIALFVVLFSKKAGRGFAGFVEYLAILGLSVYTYAFLCGASGAITFDTLNLNMLVAVAGTFLFVIIQGFACKKGSGVAKFFIFLLSTIAALFLFDVSALFPALDFIKGTGTGVATVTLLIYDPSLFIEATGSVSEIIYAYSFRILSVALLVNWLCDNLSLVTNSNKAGKVVSYIRYTITFLAALVAIVTSFICGETVPVYMYAIVVIQAILLTITTARIKNCKKAAQVVEDEDEEDEDEESVQPEIAQPVEETDGGETVVEQDPSTQVIVPIIVPTPAAEQTNVKTSNEQVVQNRTVVYNVQNVYNGPTDLFMNSLTDEEKIEFHSTFILKNKGTFSFLPEYEIGGNNQEFFSTIFIYLGKFRNILSTNLMNKIYVHLNLLR